jgi:hypothetical protein
MTDNTWSHRTRVLIVDDNEAVLTYVGDLLR